MKIVYAMFFTLTKWSSGSKLRFVGFISIMFCCSVLKAQVLQKERYESPLGELDQGYSIAPADNKGIYVYRKAVMKSSEVLEIAFIDTTLQQKWHGYLPVKQNFVVAKQKFQDSSLYLLLRHFNSWSNDYQIIAIRNSNGRFIQYNIPNFIPLNLTDFDITKKAALIGGYINNTPVVIYYDLKTLSSKIVPGLFNEQGELTQVKTYPDGTFDVLVIAKNLMRKKSILVRNYSDEGLLLRSVTLDPGEDKNLIFGRSIKTPDNMEVVAGTYSNFVAEVSKGIFTANINGEGLKEIHYYNYGDLPHFFNYLSARREARIKDRIQRRRIKGRKIRFNYRLLVHELIPYRGQFVLLGEAFYPHYSYPNGTYGTLSSARYAVFDGYYYTHAVVVGLDRNGKVLWDNSFEINDVKSYSLQQFVKIDAQDNKIALLYLYGNKIRSKIIAGDSLLEGKSSEPVKLKFETDMIHRNDTDNSLLEYWYGHYFIAYGIQRVTDERSGSRRKVFFINKIVHK